MELHITGTPQEIADFLRVEAPNLLQNKPDMANHSSGERKPDDASDVVNYTPLMPAGLRVK